MNSCREKRPITFRRELMAVVLSSLLVMAIVIIGMMFGTNYYFTFQSAKTRVRAQMNMEKDVIERQMYTILQAGKLAADNAVLRRNIEGKEPEEGAFINEVSMELLHILKLDDLIQFVAVTREKDAVLNYVGEKWIPDKGLIYDQLYESFQAAFPVEEKVRVIQTKDVFGSGHYSILFFFEVTGYDPVLKRLGMVCIAVDERALSALMESVGASSFVDSVLTDEKGTVFSAKDESLIGKKQISTGSSRKENGYLFQENLVLASSFDSLGWSIISSISVTELMKGYLPALVMIVVIAAIIIATAVFLNLRHVNHLNRTLQDLQEQMAFVAEGNMTTRMGEAYREQEFVQISNSFNRMADAVGELMIRISEEQNQMKQIEMNALQSQIQPHFLYNTLDIIHWQAVMDGNATISLLVKALAQYYRLSLGRGKDIVDLKAELDHIRNYLIIQNTRLENRLNLKIEVSEDLIRTRIPKMTLQPLVENAVEHGLKNVENKKGTITIRAIQKKTDILVSVEDDGIGMSAEKLKELNESIRSFDVKTGYGLQNVNRRLQLYFGEAFGIFCESEKGHGTTVFVHLPKEEIG